LQPVLQLEPVQLYPVKQLDAFEKLAPLTAFVVVVHLEPVVQLELVVQLEPVQLFVLAPFTLDAAFVLVVQLEPFVAVVQLKPFVVVVPFT